MKFSFSVSQVENDGDVVWVAESKELKNCLGVGDTQVEALAELEENELTWLEMAKENGYPIPNPRVEKVQTYSGKLTLRISPKEHELAAKQAGSLGISLNQFICDAVVAYTHQSHGEPSEIHLQVANIAKNVSSFTRVPLSYSPNSYENSYLLNKPGNARSVTRGSC